MSITADKTVTIADVEISEDYRIALHMRRRRTVLMWSDAEQLAEELLRLVARAKTMLAEDFEMPDPETWRGVHHLFDVAPVCRDCSEGKHGACIGSAYVESEDGVDEVRCGCAAVEHQVHGSAA